MRVDNISKFLLAIQDDIGYCPSFLLIDDNEYKKLLSHHNTHRLDIMSINGPVCLFPLSKAHNLFLMGFEMDKDIAMAPELKIGEY